MRVGQRAKHQLEWEAPGARRGFAEDPFRLTERFSALRCYGRLVQSRYEGQPCRHMMAMTGRQQRKRVAVEADRVPQAVGISAMLVLREERAAEVRQV
ncbi:hypothetical protein [Streptomyces europaeiscabiei]|uniref:hypothetical protein n=1 Tax=Streptomyces europaeiscabiei TaxID=146819 RepID=UPI0029A0D528|nr:hypothetical protein [Streptomyces europaeiscabiei]MDX3583391.1 hypothetical protein [Streptomyces europaeiscabiei]